MDLLLLLGALATILLGAELFTNGIEWFGHKLELAEGAVGSVLAAVGTALPETMIPLVAILFSGGVSASEVGIGAILGAPFMLGTLAMFVTGAAVLLVGRRRPGRDLMLVDPLVLWRDVRFFVLFYALVIAVAFLPVGADWPRRLAAVAVLLGYAYYVYEHLGGEATGSADDLAPLRLHRWDRWAPAELNHPRLRIVAFQVVAAVVLIVAGAWAFVEAVGGMASTLGLDSTLLALIVAPIATELPEKFNSVIWVRQGKDTLAMGNITGAMVFQSAIPPAIALVFAAGHWTVGEASGLAFASAGIAFLSMAAIFVPMARRGHLRGRHLLVGGLFYVAYVAIVLVRLGGG